MDDETKEGMDVDASREVRRSIVQDGILRILDAQATITDAELEQSFKPRGRGLLEGAKTFLLYAGLIKRQGAGLARGVNFNAFRFWQRDLSPTHAAKKRIALLKNKNSAFVACLPTSAQISEFPNSGENSKKIFSQENEPEEPENLSQVGEND